MKLLAILIAFGLFHWIRKPKTLQSFAWWVTIVAYFKKHDWLKPMWLNRLIVLLLPVVIVALLARFFLIQHEHQLWYLVFNSLILYYCLGPEQLEVGAKEIKLPEDTDSENSMQWLISKLTNEAIHRWFAVIFWFVVMGAAGALLYRLIEQMLAHEETTSDGLIGRLYALLSYPVIWLMTLSLLIASDFDRIWHHCQRYLKRQDWYRQHLPLLYEAMDFAVENCEIEDFKSDDFLTVRNTTLAVLKRMLMVWLVLVAFIVLINIG
ncbi:hypothetical protein [Marinicella gelatinilytica]|uniref:hypothetical protein n=1 Tax=Marinicella gelatinilytica TaxID=2996017 RepID=UPI002260AC15|nr:hypothetical protein [Marinicella gelatinilytica]MCX7544778.1 hypothetical protein [Marinicella gelatinilytica]